MSTILDALKKSEQERKLNKLPTLTDMQAPQEPSRWPKIIAASLSVLVLSIVIASAIYWWQSRGNPRTAQSLKADQPVTAPVMAAETQEPLINADEVVVNVVSFSELPEQRFAMVNGKMVREGDFVEAGLLVEKIEMDAVVLNLRGKQFSRKP